ncbi:hypothetical protein [Roseobacter sp. OBYS 0001]|uniref:hypothetical protein n=1 Tax=Roseobacter sp. OBYS 0001 TaxID=882651 RepID=UPI001BB94E94|nr:hypothetical protein [Roseobacter sp. OBYS 0001]GIT85449.1 hypothetical protein ROBYS_04650 [Roseobacter sp. OBYS 0001]
MKKYETFLRTASLMTVASTIWVISGNDIDAKDASPQIARTTFDANNRSHVPQIDFLKGEAIDVYTIGSDTIYVPRPVPDWAGLEAEIDATCEKASALDEAIPFPRLTVLYYNNEILSELSRKVGVEKTKLQPLPHYAKRVRLERGRDSKVIYQTSYEGLVDGQIVTESTPLQAIETYEIEATCGWLNAFLRNPKLQVGYQVFSSTYQAQSISITADFDAQFSSMIENKSQESETDRVTVSIRNRGGRLSFELGPLSLNGGGGGQTTERQVERSRVVSRDWLSERITSMSTAYQIEERCEGEAEACGTPDFRNAVLNFINQDAERLRAEVASVSAENTKLVAAGIERPADATVDEDIKAFLKFAAENATTEEAELTDGKVKAKAKKSADDKIEIDGKSEWSRKGDAWVPTDFDLDLVDVAKMEARVQAGYRRLAINSAVRATVRVPHVNTEFPAGFAELSAIERYREFEQDSHRLPSVEAELARAQDMIKTLNKNMNNLFVGQAAIYRNSALDDACSNSGGRRVSERQRVAPFGLSNQAFVAVCTKD